jgi:DNA-binding transcriptional MerR regulator
MDVSIPDKAYFRIGEVARILSVEPHVIRYWESEFKSLKPVRSKSDQRLYRKKDVETLLAIKRLLYEEHFTISGARQQLVKLKSVTEEQGKEETVQNKEQMGGLDRLRLIQIKKVLQEIRQIV